VQAAVAAKMSRSDRAIRLVGIEEREVFIQPNSELIDRFWQAQGVMHSGESETPPLT
jgi:hypothetical protein